MNEGDRMTTERRGQRPRPVRTTLALDPEAALLLRVACDEWSETQGSIVGLALRWFVATGAADAERVRIGEGGQARIDAALKRAESAGKQARLDPRIHAPTFPIDGGGDAGVDGGGCIKSDITAIRARHE